MDPTLIALSVIAVIALALWMRRRETKTNDNPSSTVSDGPDAGDDPISDAFYAKFDSGYRETVKLKIFEQADRVVIRSILYAEGIPTAEWYGHATRATVGAPNFGSNLPTLLLVEEDVRDAARIIGDYWNEKYHLRDFRGKVEFLGIDVSTLVPWIFGEERAPYPPEFSPLDVPRSGDDPSQ